MHRIIAIRCASLQVVKDRGLPITRRIPAASGCVPGVAIIGRVSPCDPLPPASLSAAVGLPLVEKTRFELATSCVQGRRSPS